MFKSHGFFNIDGFNLEYQRFSPSQSNDLTLIFLHEGLGCLAMWKDFPHQVAQATGYQVLVYSRTGYGGSDPCTLPRPLTFMHDEGMNILPKVLEAAEIQKAILVGHSDGASISLINAGGIADERIQGLVLMAPHVFVEELTLTSIHEARVAYENTDLRKRLARYHGDNVDCAFWGWNQVWLNEGFLSWNLEEYLPTIAVPVLLIQGEDDNYGTIRQLEKISEKVPGDVVVTLLSGCGHSPFRDRPSETLQAIMVFLQQKL